MSVPVQSEEAVVEQEKPKPSLVAEYPAEALQLLTDAIDKEVAKHGLSIVKLDPKPGDVLVLKVQDGVSAGTRRMYYDAMRRFLNGSDYARVRLLLLDSKLEIEQLSEEQMFSCGWVRAKV